MSKASNRWHTSEKGRAWMKEWRRKYYAIHANRIKKRELERYRLQDPRKRKDKYLRSLYGVGIDWYEAQLKKQNGVCAICKQFRGRRLLHVDHNHKTNVRRALLCHFCNVALGQMQENPSWLREAADYLERSWEETN